MQRLRPKGFQGPESRPQLPVASGFNIDSDDSRSVIPLTDEETEAGGGKVMIHPWLLTW